MKIIVAVLFTGLLCMVPVSAPAGELPPTMEVTLYVSGQFQSAACKSPDVSSPAPYWSINGTPLNDKQINTHYGAVVSRGSGGEGHHLSTLYIPWPAVNLTLNGSLISCLVNMTVILHYHVTVVEFDLVYLSTEEYRSALCVSPSVTSPAAPYFMFNDTPLNGVQINGSLVYQANVTRSSSLEGRHWAAVDITALNSTLNGSTVTCMVNSAVIWKVQLIIESDNALDATIVPTTVESDTTNDGVAQDVSVDTSKSTSTSHDSSAAAWITVLVVLVITAIIGLNVTIAIYICKQGGHRRVDKPENTENRTNNDDQQQPPPTSSGDPTCTTSDSVVPQDDETITSQPVISISPMTVVHKNERHTSFSRDTDGNGVPSVTDVVLELDTSTSPFIPLKCSFEHLHRENESEMTSQPPPVVIPTSREEQCSSDHEGQSLAVACLNGNKNYDPRTMAKCWHKSSDGAGSNRLCYVLCANGISDGNNNESLDGSFV